MMYGEKEISLGVRVSEWVIVESQTQQFYSYIIARIS